MARALSGGTSERRRPFRSLISEGISILTYLNRPAKKPPSNLGQMKKRFRSWRMTQRREKGSGVKETAQRFRRDFVIICPSVHEAICHQREKLDCIKVTYIISNFFIRLYLDSNTIEKLGFICEYRRNVDAR